MAKTKKAATPAVKPGKKKPAVKAVKSGKKKPAKAAVKEIKEIKLKKRPTRKAAEPTPDSQRLCDAVVEGMKEKKASNIVVIDLRNLKNAIADFFVVCSGNSDKQLEAIAQSVDEVVFKQMNENPWHAEGKNNKEWMLLDYITVVAHVFKNDRRQFYSLEKLWGDAEITEIDD